MNKQHRKNENILDENSDKCESLIDANEQEFSFENAPNSFPIIKEEMVVVKLEEVEEDRPEFKPVNLGQSELFPKLENESRNLDLDCNSTSISVKHEPIL